MANRLSIIEYTELPRDSRGAVLLVGSLKKAVSKQNVAIPGTSSALRADTRFVRLQTNAACLVEAGSGTPSTDTNSPPLAANQTEYFEVNGGDKIAVSLDT